MEFPSSKNKIKNKTAKIKGPKKPRGRPRKNKQPQTPEIREIRDIRDLENDDDGEGEWVEEWVDEPEWEDEREEEGCSNLRRMTTREIMEDIDREEEENERREEKQKKQDISEIDDMIDQIDEFYKTFPKLTTLFPRKDYDLTKPFPELYKELADDIYRAKKIINEPFNKALNEKIWQFTTVGLEKLLVNYFPDGRHFAPEPTRENPDPVTLSRALQENSELGEQAHALIDELFDAIPFLRYVTDFTDHRVMFLTNLMLTCVGVYEINSNPDRAATINKMYQAYREKSKERNPTYGSQG